MPSGAPDVRLKLTVEYDGTEFCGWAAQPELRTVEKEVRAALAAVFPAYDKLAVAGRTDTGVHALRNVVSVDVEGGPPAARAAEALNAGLPDDVAVVAAEQAASDFHARHSARSRSYRYRIWRRRAPSPFEDKRSWWYPRPVDERRLADAADLLLGEHDFRAFTPTEPQHEVFKQDGWDEHAQFVDGLSGEGLVVFGGPLGDPDAGPALLVFRAESEAEIRRRLADDPWMDTILRIESILPWSIWVGTPPG